jgi:hypothetical protein
VGSDEVAARSAVVVVGGSVAFVVVGVLVEVTELDGALDASADVVAADEDVVADEDVAAGPAEPGVEVLHP